MVGWTDLISIYTNNINTVLPDENILGEPFWVLMEIKDGENTGNYHSIGKRDNKSLIMLFPQKDMANWAEERLAEHSGDFKVRGVSKEHLEVLLRLCEDGYPLEFVVAASELNEGGDLCGAVMSPFQIRNILAMQ